MTDEEKALMIEMNKAILTMIQMMGMFGQNVMQLNKAAGENLVPKFNDFIAKNQHLMDPQIQVADATVLKKRQ